MGMKVEITGWSGFKLAEVTDPSSSGASGTFSRPNHRHSFLSALSAFRPSASSDSQIGHGNKPGMGPVFGSRMDDTALTRAVRTYTSHVLDVKPFYRAEAGQSIVQAGSRVACVSPTWWHW